MDTRAPLRPEPELPLPTSIQVENGETVSPARKPPSTHNDLTEANYDIVVGQATHRAIGALVAQRPLPNDQHRRLVAIIDAAAEGCAGYLTTTHKGRALRQAVATAAGVYVGRYMLPPAWSLMSTEHRVPGSRFDLCFRHTDGSVLIDEIKRSASRANHTSALAQVARYQAAAVDLWGSRFVGVRLLWLAAPLNSQFFAPTNRYGRRLCDVSDPRLVEVVG